MFSRSVKVTTVNVTDMATTEASKNVYYLQQICSDLPSNAFKTPWGSVLIHNCDESGKLLEFSSVSDYKVGHKSLWLNLKLMLFSKDCGTFPVWCCPECPSMRGFTSMGVQHNEEDLLQYLCIHSRAASFLLPNWESIWNVGLNPGAKSMDVLCNSDIEVVNCKEKDKDNLFLAAVLSEGKVHVLFTVTKRQKAPFCATFPAPFCSTQKCKHHRKYEEITNKSGYKSVFSPNFGINRISEESERQEEEEEEHVSSAGEKSPVSNDGEFDEENSDIESEAINPESQDHYLHKLSPKEFAKMCGYNFSKIPYPFKRSRSMQAVWLKRQRNEYVFPPSFIPEYSDDNECKEHGNKYDSNDDNLIRESGSIIIFNETSDQIYDTIVFSRKTVGRCKCRQQYDGHQELLWHLGKGKFVNYCVLLNYLHNFVNGGLSLNAQYASILDNNESNGTTSQLTYNDLHRAVVGFFRNLDINTELAFSCPNHGSKPKWITADGKNLGPTKKRCKNVSELDRHPEDDQKLAQSTAFKDRVFLPLAEERVLVCALLAEQISNEEFLASPDITSEAGLLISNLIQFLEESQQGDINPVYKRLISNLCKPTSARGFLQVTNFLPLEYLGSFCREELSLKDVKNIEELRTVSKELPVLWQMLNDVCNFEQTSFLPRTISRIILKLLEIRMNSFLQSTSRTDAQYIPYDGPEHPTMCYPNHPIKFYPKKYKVNQKIDADLCKKAFIGHSDFTAGIFTIGCACEYNTTLGFELMIHKESPQNLFRVLKCRDFDYEQLEGILIDHACLVDRYMMNREAPMLEWKRLLVDGAHWSSQKKFKAPNTKGKGGHLGCSEGFNWNSYKHVVDGKVNSQGREQMHSLLENCAESLRLMSYQNFMIFMRGKVHNILAAIFLRFL